MIVKMKIFKTGTVTTTLRKAPHPHTSQYFHSYNNLISKSIDKKRRSRYKKITPLLLRSRFLWVIRTSTFWSTQWKAKLEFSLARRKIDNEPKEHEQFNCGTVSCRPHVWDTIILFFIHFLEFIVCQCVMPYHAAVGVSMCMRATTIWTIDCFSTIMKRCTYIRNGVNKKFPTSGNQTFTLSINFQFLNQS